MIAALAREEQASRTKTAMKPPTAAPDVPVDLETSNPRMKVGAKAMRESPMKGTARVRNSLSESARTSPTRIAAGAPVWPATNELTMTSPHCAVNMKYLASTRLSPGAAPVECASVSCDKKSPDSSHDEPTPRTALTRRREMRGGGERSFAGLRDGVARAQDSADKVLDGPRGLSGGSIWRSLVRPCREFAPPLIRRFAPPSPRIERQGCPAPARRARARPGHPRRAEPANFESFLQRRGVDGRDKPGQDAERFYST